MKNMKEKENENMKKKILALALAGVLVVGALTGCGSSKSESSDKKTDDKKITVAASATPHAEILEEAKTLLKDKGYELEVKVFDDYVQPNNVGDCRYSGMAVLEQRPEIRRVGSSEYPRNDSS